MNKYDVRKNVKGEELTIKRCNSFEEANRFIQRQNRRNGGNSGYYAVETSEKMIQPLHNFLV